MNQYYQKIGLPLKLWIKTKYGSQKNCCRILGIKPSYLSMIIKGKRKANRETIQKFRFAGFEADLFYYYLQIDDMPEKLSFNEVSYIVKELKELIYQKDIIVESLEMEIRNYKNKIIELRQKINKNVNYVNFRRRELNMKF